MAKHFSRETKRQQKKRFKRKHQRAYRKKIARLRKLQQTNIVFQIVHTIHELFPDLFDRLRDINEVRKKTSEYEQADC